VEVRVNLWGREMSVSCRSILVGVFRRGKGTPEFHNYLDSETPRTVNALFTHHGLPRWREDRTILGMTITAKESARSRDHSSGLPGYEVQWTRGEEHWTTREHGEIDLFMWHKPAAAGVPFAGTVLFVHGSSMASQPTFDLTVPGRPDSSAMDWFRARGFDTWTLDNEGYGRSSKHREINFDIGNGADDLAAASAYILERARSPGLMVYGISSGALKAALFAQRHPERVARLALDAFVWTGEGSPTLAKRRERMDEWTRTHRRPIDLAFVHSIFNRDHPGTAEDRAVNAFAEAILSLDNSMPTGTYVDMCSRLPLVNPAKLEVPTIVMRGEYDGIASFDDLLEFFRLLPNGDKQFTVMAGISHASFQQKNYRSVYHVLHGFFTGPAQVYP
jgi:pimeloyl-ACP methyl ester carboxylesterase